MVVLKIKCVLEKQYAERNSFRKFRIIKKCIKKSIKIKNKYCVLKKQR